MNIHTAPHGLDFPLPRVARQPAQQVRIAPLTAPRASLMERLAAWAERQPAHHHMGSWEQFR